jgi:hypothetical protein
MFVIVLQMWSRLFDNLPHEPAFVEPAQHLAEVKLVR